jgi:spore germination protein KB
MKTKTSEFCAMMSFMMLSCFLGIGAESCLLISGIDYWLVPILGTIIGFPILLIYLSLFNKNKSLPDLMKSTFGNKIGNILNILLLLCSITFNLVTFWNLISFVTSQYLYETPSWFITLLFTITAIYLLTKSERVIFRTSFMLFYIAIFLYLISFFGLSLQVKITNIMPFLEYGITPVLKGIYTYISYMILPIFFLLIIPKKNIENNKLNKAIIITYFITNLAIFLIMFIVISVFGIELTKLYQYPAYQILKRVFIGGFIERMENTIAINWIIILFISSLFSYYFTKEMIKKIFNFKEIIIYILLVIIMFYSQYIFKNNTIGEDIFLRIYPIILGIFLIGIPLITFIKTKK